jgi:glutamyl-Q tRNA(Asp) synthetase
VFAYHLACVVDDAETTDAGGGGFTHVVRGADLIASTPRQIFVQHALGLPTPAYLHLPVALDARGDKLSKQTRAAPVDVAAPIATLAGALRFLGHGHVVDALGADPDLPVDVWLRAAATRWDRACLPRAAALAWR